MTLQYRHQIAKALPPGWLFGPNVQSFFTEGLAVLYDADREWLRAARFNQMPTFCDDSALPLLLLDRRLRRGPFTPPLAVRRYLRVWMEQWQLAGLFPGLLLAIQAFLAPEYPQVRIWTQRSVCYTMAKGTVGRALGLPGYAPLAVGPDGDTSLSERLRWSGAVERVVAAPGTWDWYSISNPSYTWRWWHFWPTIHGLPLYAPWNYDSGVNYDDESKSWGCSYPHGDLAVLGEIIRDHAPHEARPHTVVICPLDSDFDPNDANAGDPAFGWPDGQWGWEVKPDGAGGAVDARRTDLRYFHSNEGD